MENHRLIYREPPLRPHSLRPDSEDAHARGEQDPRPGTPANHHTGQTNGRSFTNESSRLNKQTPIFRFTQRSHWPRTETTHRALLSPRLRARARDDRARWTLLWVALTRARQKKETRNTSHAAAAAATARARRVSVLSKRPRTFIISVHRNRARSREETAGARPRGTADIPDMGGGGGGRQSNWRRSIDGNFRRKAGFVCRRG